MFATWTLSARLCLLVWAATVAAATTTTTSSVEQPPETWALAVSALLRDCPAQPQRSFVCARRRALAAIDRILQDDRIPLVDGLYLLKYERPASNASSSVTLSIRNLLARIRERGEDQKDEEGEEGLCAKLMKRVARVLKTHVIKIDTERLRADGQVEGRGRRRRRRQMQMMPIIMMGVLLMGSVLIPMGFQFLAVLGGKALILAKMALMLSSIQGLKKIATNGVNYGLYHTPVPEAWHERSTAGLELPAYAQLPSYAQLPQTHGYLEPSALGYLPNRRSASLQPT